MPVFSFPKWVDQIAAGGVTSLGPFDLKNKTLGTITEMKESNDSIWASGFDCGIESRNSDLPQKFLLVISLDGLISQAASSKEGAGGLLELLRSFFSVASSLFELVVLADEFSRGHWAKATTHCSLHPDQLRVLFVDSQMDEVATLWAENLPENIVAILGTKYAELVRSQEFPVVEMDQWWSLEREEAFLKGLTALFSRQAAQPPLSQRTWVAEIYQLMETPISNSHSVTSR